MTDCEKKYNEALERAKELLLGNEHSNTIRSYFEHIFPELRESEDERIRKALILHLQSFYSNEVVAPGISKEMAIAWLEKQKVNTDGDFARGYDCGYECCLNSHGAEWFEKQKDCIVYRPGHPDPIGKEGEDGMEILEKQKEQKPILEVFGFKVGDAVRLKDGDGRKHIIKSFEEVEGVHGPNFYHVEFEDNSARDGIYPGEEYPNGYYTQMEKFEKEQKPAWSEELDIDTLREWSMRYAPDIRQAIESTAYHFYNLRPHWKPSEHQMNILKAVKEYVGRGSGYWGEGLGSLIEDLEKLM